VFASKILLEGVPRDDYLRGPSGLNAAHRPEPLLELAVISLYRVVGVPLDVMPGRGNQLALVH
jgi:hypothetical protein